MITKVNRQLVLNTLIKHETLTIDDIADPGNLGIKAEAGQLQQVLQQLLQSGFITTLDGVHPTTYTITTEGIEEGERLKIAEASSRR